MSISQVEMCNMALGKIGHKRFISDIYPDEDTEPARQCYRFWEGNRDFVLSDAPWRCARKRTELSELETAPDFGWDYQFTLPSDFIREVEVLDSSEIPTEYTIENVLLANTDTIYLKYIYKLTDTTKYHPMLLEAMVTRLAHLLAMPLTGDKSIKDMMFKEYGITLQMAKEANAFEYVEDKVKKRDSWIKSRFRGGTQQEFGETPE